MLLAALAAGCSSPDRQLRILASKRLALAPDVAWAKFQSQQPIHDPVREAKVLAATPNPGQRRFFSDQMAASRAIQARLIEGWKSGGPRPDATPRSLPGEIRPAIDAIDGLQRAALARGARPLTTAEIETLARRLAPYKHKSPKNSAAENASRPETFPDPAGCSK